MQFLFKRTKINTLNIFLIILLFIDYQSFAVNISRFAKLNWSQKSDIQFAGKNFSTFLDFTGSSINLEKGYLPEYFINLGDCGSSIKNIVLENAVFEPCENKNFQGKEFLNSEIRIEHTVSYENGKAKLLVWFVPIKKVGIEIQKLISFTIKAEFDETIFAYNALNKAGFSANSVLATGDWYKIATTANGIYRIDYTFLKTIGIDADAIDPRNIKIYGNGAGMLPELVRSFRYDDLQENAIYIQGESDGKFNPSDYILFYGQSQRDVWRFDNTSKKYLHSPNLYSDTCYYFISINAGIGKRTQTQISLTIADSITTSYDALYFHENDLSNLIKSGRTWFGEEFNDRQRSQNFNINIPNLRTDNPIFFTSEATSRAPLAQTLTITSNSQSVLIHDLPALWTLGFEDPFTNGLQTKSASFFPNSSNLNINYSYAATFGQTANAWLNWFRIQGRADLKNTSGQLVFSDLSSINMSKNTQFNINSGRSLTIWDVSIATTPFKIDGTFDSGLSIFSFIANTDSLKTFVAFDGSNYLIPKPAGKLNNQNLHGLPAADFVIITHPAFKSEADRLAKFHIEKDAMKVQVVTTFDVYNEFSSGSQDISAIRDFLKMYYSKYPSANERLKYALFFGRASYDYKNRIKENTNYFPTFENTDSWNPIGSFCTDDFFACIDDNEGNMNGAGANSELLDIGIGRIPCITLDHAKGVVDKIINYSNNKSFGDWRNRVTYVADDDYENIGFNEDIENYGDIFLNKFHKFNVGKVLTNAYIPVYTAGGKRSPDAQNSIVKAVQNGCLMLNYTGHGGEVGWSARRILNTDDINSWTNFNSLPLFITATCEFSRYDDPARVSAGEMVLLNPNGGGIALFTTVRLVFSSSNQTLNFHLHNNLGLDTSKVLSPLYLGNLMRNTKNSYPSSNTRNFILLGDPALRLAYPQWSVSTTSVNGKLIGGLNDTLKALSKVTITGIVTDANGRPLTNFNGVVYPTVFDKMDTLETIDVGPSNPAFKFRLQNNVIYRGKATVTNGAFQFSFIVPKDISYQYGLGKISYYANNDVLDACGYDNLFVGGTADSSAIDKNGPEIKLYMNDSKFVFGGTTDENPLFIANIFDSSGINTVGRGIGRDLIGTMTLKDENNNTIHSSTTIMNEYFQAAINSYQAGEVKYKYNKLTPSQKPYHLTFRVYDVYNNSNQAELEFFVASSSELAIKNVLNYPNPFTTKTTFHFDHNKAGEEMNVMIQIFTVSGKLVKTLTANKVTPNSHFDQLEWNGKDEYNDEIAKGVYVYKVKIATASKTVEEFQKLVILK